MPKIASGSAPNRIAELRRAAGLTQAELGDQLGDVHWTTVSGLERGKPKLTLEWMDRIASVLQVRPRDLLLEDAESASEETTRVAHGGLVAAGGAIDTTGAQDEPGVEYEIELLMRFPEARIAYEVVGDSMLPVYKAGSVIVCKDHTPYPTDLLNEDVAVATPDGSRYIKQLIAGREPGLYTLLSYNSSPMIDVEVEWAAEIVATVTKRQWRRVEKQRKPFGRR